MRGAGGGGGAGGGPWLPSWRARDSLPARPLECAVFRFPWHPTEVTRGPGSGWSSRQGPRPRRRDAQRAAAAQGERPLQARAGERRAATHRASARFVYLRAASAGSPPPRARSRHLRTSRPRRWAPGSGGPALCGARLAGASPQAT